MRPYRQTSSHANGPLSHVGNSRYEQDAVILSFQHYGITFLGARNDTFSAGTVTQTTNQEI